MTDKTFNNIVLWIKAIIALFYIIAMGMAILCTMLIPVGLLYLVYKLILIV